MLYRIVIAGAVVLVLMPQFDVGAEVVSLAGMLTPMVISVGEFRRRQKHGNGARSTIGERLESLRKSALRAPNV
jgi:hypothetical protein